MLLTTLLFIDMKFFVIYDYLFKDKMSFCLLLAELQMHVCHKNFVCPSP